jgi:type IV pilus assembly protein PilV
MMSEITKQIPVTRPHHQNGVGLIDVMIAVVVFSVGMLALATLQTVNKQSNYEAIQRSTAAVLANDILERMRMNSLKIEAGTYKSSLANYVPSTTPVVLNYNSPRSLPSPNCNAATCTPVQIAAWDLYEFQQMLLGANETANNKDVGGILNPTACLTTTTTDGRAGQYVVTIAWKGQVKLENKLASLCGDGNYGANNEYRRIFQITSHMNCPEPGGCET